MQLTPADAAKREITCRFIPLNDRGETIESFYRSGTAEELESAFGGWLRSTIERRESKYGCQRCVPALPAPSEKTNSTKLCGEEKPAMISECANQHCRVTFDYHRGHYFRFHKVQRPGEQRPNTHCVQHFWLCQGCFIEYTLNYQADRGVVLLRQPEISNKCETCCFVAAA